MVNHIGERVGNLMDRKKLTIHQVGKRSGISVNRLTVILTAEESDATDDEVNRIAVALLVDRSDIVKDQPTEDPDLKNRIRWHLSTVNRPEWFDEVVTALKIQASYRGSERSGISDLVILQLIYQRLDQEESDGLSDRWE